MYRIPFGQAHLDFELPSGTKADIAVSNAAEPLENLGEAIAGALSAPINAPPLKEMAKRGSRVCIVFTDITRKSPDHLLVPAILDDLETAGVRNEDVVLLCGTGMHRPSTPQEKMIKLGQSVVERYRVVDNDPQNPAALVELGVTDSGIPLSVNRLAYESDLLIATGIVEPHQYAGYSGGRKTLSVGAGGEEMIAFTHGPQMIDHPGTRLGRIEGNPFHEAITETARRAGLSFILNVVQDEGGKAVALMGGEPKATFEALVEVARKIFEVPIDRQYDVAVAGVGFPKDVNIYQASRAPSYLFFAPIPVVKEGGVFIVPAPTPEGIGEGVGEHRFLEKMSQAADMQSLLNELRRTGYPPGAQRAFVMAKVLEKTQVIFVGSQTPELVRKVRMTPAPDMDTAFDLAAETIGRRNLDVLIVPHALLTLPIVRGST
jgi:nickel-dependent lactate racemase